MSDYMALALVYLVLFPVGFFLVWFTALPPRRRAALGERKSDYALVTARAERDAMHAAIAAFVAAHEATNGISQLAADYTDWMTNYWLALAELYRLAALAPLPRPGGTA